MQEGQGCSGRVTLETRAAERNEESGDRQGSLRKMMALGTRGGGREENCGEG